MCEEKTSLRLIALNLAKSVLLFFLVVVIGCLFTIDKKQCVYAVRFSMGKEKFFSCNQFF